MKRLLYQGKATHLILWLEEITAVYKDCTVSEFIADSERHARAIAAVKKAEETA